MKNCFGLVFLVAVILSSVHASAESLSGPYLVAGAGTLRYAGLVPPSGTEAEILDTPGVIGGYEVDDKSSFETLGFGWRFNRYISVDLSHLRGVKLSTKTSVSNVNVGELNIDGQMFDVGDVPANTVFSREAEVSALKLGINGQYPVTSWVDITASIEAYRWKATVINKITVDASGYYVGYNESDSGTVPAAAIGFVFKPTKQLDVIVQYRHMNKVTMPSLSLRYSL